MNAKSGWTSSIPGIKLDFGVASKTCKMYTNKVMWNEVSAKLGTVKSLKSLDITGFIRRVNSSKYSTSYN